MKYDFDQVINRKNTDSLKFDFAEERGRPKDVLPLWVADMDFAAPQPVLDALTARIQHGIFGYTDTREDYFEIVSQWFSQRHGYSTEASWLVKTPGIVYAICAAIRTFTAEGDSVLIQQPVYYPFAASVLDNDRRLVVNELVYDEETNKYRIDFEDFEEQIKEKNVKLFLLCSPHNPVGRVWSKEELTRMGDICLRHGVTVVSDEIHADFTYPGYQHHVFASLKPEFQDITVTCTSPTKTFNLAGFQISNIFIASEKLRALFLKEMDRSGYSQPNLAGVAACKAAYLEGASWLEQMKEYLTSNLDYLRHFLSERLPQIKLVEPEGTYLIWLDFSALGLSSTDTRRLIVEKANLWLDSGTMFGKCGAGYQRINIACPRATLIRAMEQLEAAVNSL